ncbi:MAG: alpha-amylase family glycosyl hydrolase [Porphyromonas sp.]|nr:alpha-amylase family glycosyl hydrolase [Porphyromonas sp.]
MTQRITIYQVLPRLFGNLNATNRPHGTYEVNGSGKMEDFTAERLQEIREMGFTHIWYTGIVEHATKTAFGAELPANHPDIVKGEAGSPYAIRDYYDIAPALAVNPSARMAEFEMLVERTHQAGLGVIIDFVPNHLSRQYASDVRPGYVKDFGEEDNTKVAFAPHNNFYYLPDEALVLDSGTSEPNYQEYPAKATGNNCFTNRPSRNDWYETVKLNYGIDLAGDWQTYYDPIPDTWLKMMDILNFWAQKGVDGFRCDMAELVPVPFWNWVIRKLKTGYPDLLMIAEVYQPERYGEFVNAGFDYLYDKVGLYDRMVQLIKGERGTDTIEEALQLPTQIRSHLLRFMENHDEQRLASDFIAGDGRAAFPAMCLTALVDGNPLMIYFGQELGERGMDAEGYSGLDGRTTIFDYWSVESVRGWLKGEGEVPELKKRYRQLLELARLPIFREGVYYNLNYYNPQLTSQRCSALLRELNGVVALVVVNFDHSPKEVNITLPQHALELLQISPEAVCRLSELVYRQQTYALLRPDYPYTLDVERYGMAIYLFTPIGS